MNREWNQQIEVVKEEIHRINLLEAYRWASSFSHDPNTNIGALIISANLSSLIATGANIFPPGVEPTAEQLADRNWRYEYIIHAEQAAIFEAAKNGKSTKQATMYTPWMSCTPCAKAIIASGIGTLIGHKQLIMKTPERWCRSIDQALRLLEKAGVKTLMYDGKIGDVTIQFNGFEYSP